MGQRKSTEKAGVWIPTPKQQAVLDAAQNGGFGHSVSAICIQAGVDRTSFYKWMNEDPEFVKAWTELPKKMLGHHLPGIYQALIAKAHTGDVPAAKLILELTGDYVPPAQKQVHEAGESLAQIIAEARRGLDGGGGPAQRE